MKSEGFKRQGHNNLDSKGTVVVWYHFRRGENVTKLTLISSDKSLGGIVHFWVLASVISLISCTQTDKRHGLVYQG